MADYTSNSEFDLETRVQITNEMPSTRDYDMMNHTLRNDTWKWLIGTEDITYDLPVGGDAARNLEAPVKIVNGKQAENYGPKKKQVWDPINKRYNEVAPTFHKMSISGVLSSEHDLFLHEIYRYLNCLYPDHPDWLQLLTRNEILDAFNNAAAMVDYKPNNEFFRIVAESIQSTDPDVEEFKLNLRNLKDNAARRKFYGSMLGYRMIGHDSYENISVFPVSKVITLDAVNKDEWDKDHSRGFDVKKYIVDTFDERYGTYFRHIDWQGNNRDISFADTSGYQLNTYSILGYEDTQFEFVTSKEGAFSLEEYRLNKDSAYSFYDLTSESLARTGSISEIVYYNTYDPVLTTTLSYVSSDDKLIGIKTSQSTPLIYNTLYKYKSFSDIVQFLKDNDLEDNVYSQYSNIMPYNNGILQMNNSKWFSTFISSVAAVIGRYGGMGMITEEAEFSYNPIIRDTIQLPIDIMIDCYDKDIKFNKDGTPINVGNELSLENATIHKNDNITLIKYDKYPTLYKVAGGNFGQIKIEANRTHRGPEYNAILSYEPFNTLNSDIVSNDNYGAIVYLSNGNYGVLYGSIKIDWAVYFDDVAYFAPAAITFNIRAIPDKMLNSIYKRLYGTDADDLIYNLQLDIKSKEDEIKKNYNLIIQDLDGDSTYIDGYINAPNKIKEQEALIETIEEELSNAVADDVDEIRERLDAAKNQLEIYKTLREDSYKVLNEKALSNFINYENSVNDLDDLNNDLNDCINKKNQLTDNRNLLVDSSRCSTIRAGVKVDLFAFNFNGDITSLPYILDECFIKEFSFGNVSVQPVSLSERTTEVRVDRWEFADYNPIKTRDSVFYQMYSKLDATTKENIFTSKNIMKIYNEAEYDVTTQVYIDKSVGDVCYEMQFLSEDARNKYEALSVGSKVYGPGISGSTFITQLNNYVATINSSLPKSGLQTFTFKCPVTTSPKSIIDDTFNYKRIMYANNSYNKESFFSHGVFGTREWPNVSKALVNGDLDGHQIISKDTFFEVVNSLYKDKKTVKKDLLIPSIVKNTRSLFVEINADRLINVKNRSGDKESLMNVEWLDYISNNKDIELAKESINVGSNLILNADTSGFASLLSQAEYTDSNLKTSFQTVNWNDNTVPAYIQIGTGGSSMRNFFRFISNIQYPNVYGATFYDKTVEPYTRTDGDTVNNWITDLEDNKTKKVYKRGTYSDSGAQNEANSNTTIYNNIDKPLFEIPLNEYNINLRYYPDTRKFTTIDIMFYEQTFKNITKEYNLKVGNSKNVSKKLFDTEEYLSITNKNAVRIKSYSSIKNLYYYYGWGEDNGKLLVAYDDEDFAEYEIKIGGCIGEMPYYFNRVPYITVNTVFNLDISKFPNIENISGEEFLRRHLIIKTLTENASSYSAILDEYLNKKLESNFFDDLSKYENVFKNKLYLFTYFKGLFNKDDEDYFDLNNFDVIGLFWAYNKINYVKINKNYMLCTNVYTKNTLISDNEFNLFYGFNSYPLLKSGALDLYNENPETFIENLNTNLLDLSDSVMNYTSKIFNTISLPRNHIADGSYNINIFLDPHFTAEGYKYKDYLSKGKNADKVKYCISQSAIRYDKTNDLFYTNSTVLNEEDSFDNSIDDDFTFMNDSLVDLLQD